MKEERKILEKHARQEGCGLIIDPHIKYEQYDKEAVWIRLKSLPEFVESMPVRLINIAVSKDVPLSGNLTIVGNWFLAESVSSKPGIGNQQTIFT